MFLLLRWRLRQKRMKMRGVWKGLVRAVRINLLRSDPSERTASVLPLIVLATLLASCATRSMPPSESAKVPSKPAPRQFQPSEPYMDRVLRNIEAWDKRLRDILPTP